MDLLPSGQGQFLAFTLNAKSKVMKSITSNLRLPADTLSAFLIAIAVLWATPRNAQAQQQAPLTEYLFVSQETGTYPDFWFVSKYNYLARGPVQRDFITGLHPEGALAVSANALFVVDKDYNRVGKYNFRTGRFDASFIREGLESPTTATVSGNKLFVSSDNVYGIGHVGVYDANSGQVINTRLITGLGFVTALAVRGNTLLVAEVESSRRRPRVGTYVVDTGGVINPEFITGLNAFTGLAFVDNTLYAATYNGTVGKYEADTGKAINATLITGVQSPVRGLVARRKEYLYEKTDLLIPATASDTVKIYEIGEDGQVLNSNRYFTVKRAAWSIVYWNDAGLR
jgi:hypothetical protein